jgi:methionine synthase I (cobalamin-dependent)
MSISAININNIPFEIAKLNSKPLILDGAMGSYRRGKGFKSDDSLWMMNVNRSNPDVIIQFHNGYIATGASILTANTFKTYPLPLEKKGISNPTRYVQEAFDFTKKGVENREIIIVESNVPAKDCYQKEIKISFNKLELNHRKHIDLLIDSGVHFVLNETQNHFDELQIICEHCDKNKIPFVFSLFVEESFKILSGESLENVLSFLVEHNSLAISFSSISPHFLYKILRNIHISCNWGFYINCGIGKPADHTITSCINPDKYLETIKEGLLCNHSFVGTCCGSRPEHTKMIKEFIDGKNYN